MDGTIRLWTPGEPGRTFHHLVHHEDNESIYLPFAFEKVLGIEVEGGEDFNLIGSTYRLQNECEVIARYLKIPLDIAPESDALWEATESKDAMGGFGIEAFSLLRLIDACKVSNATKSALVFA